MSKSSGNSVRVEQWTVRKSATEREVVNKIAVRNRLGQFHGATNFRGTVVK